MSNLGTGVVKHALSARGNDLYETPDVATLALLRHEAIPRRVWEPACGPGAIVQVLRQAGHDVTATDLVEWGCPDSTSRIDFLLEQRAPDGIESIVTNPPFKNAPAFVEHALNLAAACRDAVAAGLSWKASRAAGFSTVAISPASTSSAIDFR